VNIAQGPQYLRRSAALPSSAQLAAAILPLGLVVLVLSGIFSTQVRNQFDLPKLTLVNGSLGPCDGRCDGMRTAGECATGAS
jgi:hypothetical protein